MPRPVRSLGIAFAFVLILVSGIGAGSACSET